MMEIEEVGQVDKEHTYDTLTGENRSTHLFLDEAAHGVKIKSLHFKVMIYVQITINVLLLTGLIIGFSVTSSHKVNGNWTKWSPWSACDVMFGNGSRTRFRTCTDPSPADGGRHCNGSWQDSKTCQSDFYSVRGVWSVWSAWGTCSVSCDFGIRHRERSCKSFNLNMTVHQCLGSSRDYSLCKMVACFDGGWSSWSSWGACAASCGAGMRSKYRTCSNPQPSLLGKVCEGDNSKVDLCNTNVCSEYEVSWSKWLSWSPCDVTCGNGSQTRSRTCTNTMYENSDTNHSCIGEGSDVRLCQQHSCPKYKDLVAFTAYGISGSNSSLVFSEVILNIGNGYNNLTGLFSCNVPGIYHFALQVSKAQNVFAYGVTCSIMINDNAELTATELPYLNDINNRNGYSLSLSGTFNLKENDTASVMCTNAKVLSGGRLCSFNGFLVTPVV